MQTFLRSLFLPALSLCLLAAAPMAALHAQATKIFVASFGNDANDGSRGAPKRNFQPAHDAVADKGQIVVLDTAGYGTLAISKSISVTVPPGVNGFITATGNSTAVIVSPGSSGIVSLRGLIIEGGGSVGGGTGIFVQDCGRLEVDDCVIRNFDSGVRTPTYGVNYSLARTTIRDCAFGINGLSTGNAPFGVSVIGTVDHCQFEGCTSVGIYAGGSQFSVFFLVSNSAFTKNAIALKAEGFAQFSFPVGNILVENCRIYNNTTGVTTANANGTIQSRGDNTLEANNGGNAFPSAAYNRK